MSLKRNFSAGLLSSLWAALLGLAVVPLYLKYLGIEAYGLIGFFATTQALLQLLDLGLSPTINREVARASSSGDMHEAQDLLHTLEIVFWVTAAVIVIGIVALSPAISGHWLQSKGLPQETVTHALMLMGLVVACRWPVGLYMGALMGMQKIALSSTISAAATTLSSIGAIVILAFVSQTIEAFFIWQASIGILYALFVRWVAWREMGPETDTSQFRMATLKKVWRFSAGMSGVAITGIILMQLDKVMLSRLLSLEDFGRYMLAVVTAGSLYILLTPLFNAIYPRMAALVSSGEIEKLADLYKTGTRLFLAVLFPIAIMMAVFSEDLLYLWTQDRELARSSALVVSLFLMGTSLNGVMHFPYALQLAYGETRLPLIINAILIIIMVPMTIYLAMSYGAAGGAGSWALLNCIYLLVGTWLTHRTLLKGAGTKWLLGDVLLPLFIAVMAGGAGALAQKYEFQPYIELGIGMVLIGISFTITVMISPRLRATMRNMRSKGIVGVNPI
ncbi:hypothetical protein MIZ01_2642 [Sideroxyarcus emersonii]|uniref:Polysaccharide biosynthesis protein n=1 Tax=Sideroxyarcus emersonii TaxID=2764705 RepID=A0AAN2C081_9PROT|nr:oligosaccharide flippase family protein [Sideroxyarcus emersonii]BCK88836.1 hypothetical protein MIZ01_2642 [Sideroxyarcus emersonii]